MTRLEEQIIEVLDAGQTRSPAELVPELPASFPAVEAAIEILEQKGLVEKVEPSPQQPALTESVYRKTRRRSNRWTGSTPAAA